MNKTSGCSSMLPWKFWPHAAASGKYPGATTARLARVRSWLLSLMLFLSWPAGANDQEILTQARAVMAEARYCALITVDDQGQPRARTVDPFAPDEDFVVWIATRPVTRKVAQIRAHPEVTLYYWDAANANYVTLMGRAELVDDRQTKQTMRRQADSERLYPNFPDDYLLIKVTPTWLEAIVPGFRGDRDTWRPASVEFQGNTP